MRIQVQRNIKAPSDLIWNYLADFSNIHKFHPLLKDSNFIDNSDSCEIGATRQCDMKDGNYLKERIIDWKEGTQYTIEVYESSMPMKTARATLGVQSLAPNQSKAYMHLELTPKYRIMQPMMYLYFKTFVGPSILRGLENIYQKEHELNLAN